MDQIHLPLVMFVAITVGIIVGVMVYFMFRFYIWSAITLGIIVAYIIINIIYPIGNLIEESESYVIAIYLIIEIIIPIYLFAVLIIMLFLFSRHNTLDEGLDWKNLKIQMRMPPSIIRLMSF